MERTDPKGATSRFDESLVQIFQVRRLQVYNLFIFFILNHACSFLVYYYLFVVFPPWQTQYYFQVSSI